jgi:hypothetical protein
LPLEQHDKIEKRKKKKKNQQSTGSSIQEFANHVEK